MRDEKGRKNAQKQMGCSHFSVRCEVEHVNINVTCTIKRIIIYIITIKNNSDICVKMCMCVFLCIDIFSSGTICIFTLG